MTPDIHREPFSFTRIRRLFSKAGAKRVSRKAVEEMIRTLNEATMMVAKESLLITKTTPHIPSYPNRKTITAEDVAIASKRLLRSQSEVAGGE